MNTLSKRACLLACGIAVLLAGCALYLFFQKRAAHSPEAAYTACIYQDGQILRSISLDQVSETYRFTVEAADGGYNIVEVSPGAIAIVEADCPDRLCVLQGRITDSLLPITCLPHRLVIELKPGDHVSDAPDAVAY